jgi:excisionase family DNA binding protein
MWQETDRQLEVAAERRLLSVQEVAAICGVSTRVVRRWIEHDHLPTHRIPGSGARGILRIDREDLDRWLAKFRHDFAEEEGPGQTMTLHGMTFIRSGKFPPRRKNTRIWLDSGRHPDSRTGEGND